jgi:Asp-tRNA(Asn)/Glu-tRNA(Gln) amidotransferase A subunit family amidase
MQSAIAALDLCALADAVAKGEVTSVKATTVALERLDLIGRKLNAVVRLDDERALHAAEAADKLRASGASHCRCMACPLHIKTSSIVPVICPVAARKSGLTFAPT